MKPLLARRSILALAGAASLGAPHPARSTGLGQPSGRIILTVSGRIAVTNAPGEARFDLAMLEALGTEAFSTTTPWYAGPVTFEGVPMARLLSHLGATGDLVTALALNDYSTDIPVSDLAKYRVLLAIKRDGAYMPVRDKGPLFIVYPFDSDPALKHQQYYSRSAWQVSRLIIK